MLRLTFHASSMRSTIPADSTPRSAISAPRNTRIATPSELSKPPPKTVHHQGRTPFQRLAMSAFDPTRTPRREGELKPIHFHPTPLSFVALPGAAQMSLKAYAAKRSQHAIRRGLVILPRWPSERHLTHEDSTATKAVY